MPKSYTDEAMSAAVADVKRNNLSVRQAAKKYSLPKSSLSDRLTGKVLEGSKWGRKPVFNTADETEMVDCALQRSEKGIGFSKSNFMRFAGVMAQSRGLQFKRGNPSDMWWRRFKIRHEQFSLRSPEPTGSARHDAMSRQRINCFFSELGNIVMSPNFKDHPAKIWNMDETGMSLNHKPSKVLAKRGAKTIHGKTSTSRELVTVIACGNALGNYIPPHFVIPGKTKRKLEGYDFESATGEESPIKGANFSVSDSGWTKDGIAKLWFTETFLKNIGPSRPQLLICDGHGSHNNVEFVELAKQHDIIIVELPSHTSNWTQPFDRTVFKSLKSHWNITLDNFIKGTGVAVGHKQFLKLFSIAWQAALKPSTIRNGFAATGIYPFNPDAIPKEAFSPNELYVSENDSLGSPTQASTVNDVVCTAAEQVDTLSEIQVTDSVTGETDNEISASSVPNNVSSVTLSVPLNLEGEFTLPIIYDSFGGLLFDSSFELPEDQPRDNANCSAEEALSIIEKTLSSEQKLKFQAALLSGNNTKFKRDPLFQTWRRYTDLVKSTNGNDNISVTTSVNVSTTPTSRISSGISVNKSSMTLSSSATAVANEIFPLPKPTKKRKETEYFVITADEVFNQKKSASELKIKQMKLKEEKRIDRERKREEKAKLNERKNEKLSDISVIEMM